MWTIASYEHQQNGPHVSYVVTTVACVKTAKNCHHHHHHHLHAYIGLINLTNMLNNTGEGRREDALVKQRNQAREEYERQKQQLINETEKARPSAHRFVGQNDSMEDSLKNSTVGLVRLEDFQQKRKELEEAKAREAARTDELK